MLMPKRVKHRKQQRGKMRGRAYRGNKVTYGDFGIMAMEPTWITSNQIEAARVSMTRLAIHNLPIKCKIVSKAEAEEMAGEHQ